MKNGKKVKLDMADKIQNAYESSKNIYDDVLTQGNIFSKLYIKLFWNGTNDNDCDRVVRIPAGANEQLYYQKPVSTTLASRLAAKPAVPVFIACELAG